MKHTLALTLYRKKKLIVIFTVYFLYKTSIIEGIFFIQAVKSVSLTLNKKIKKLTCVQIFFCPPRWAPHRTAPGASAACWCLPGPAWGACRRCSAGPLGRAAPQWRSPQPPPHHHRRRSLGQRLSVLLEGLSCFLSYLPYWRGEKGDRQDLLAKQFEGATSSDAVQLKGLSTCGGALILGHNTELQD